VSLVVGLAPSWWAYAELVGLERAGGPDGVRALKPGAYKHVVLPSILLVCALRRALRMFELCSEVMWHYFRVSL